MATRHRWIGFSLGTAVVALALGVSVVPAMAGDVVVVGGSDAVSDAVVDHLRSCTDGVAHRIAGANRYSTAVEVSRTHFTSARTVYLATGLDFPDALAVGPVAARNAAPVLLVGAAGVDPGTLDEIERLAPEAIVLLGGTSAVPDEVADALTTRLPGAGIERIAGGDRYDTAAAISRAHFRPGVRAVFLAVGSDFPDALAGGAAAAMRESPLLLTERDAIPAPTSREIERLDPGEIIVLGGPAVISEEVVGELGRFTTGGVRRLAGVNRYATAAAIALDSPAATGALTITTGTSFPDALTAAPAAAGPLLLASSHAVDPATASALGSLTGVSCAPFLERSGPVLAIGDSVMLGAASQLVSMVDQLTVDAAVSRQFSAASSIAASALRGSSPPAAIVIHLGTNGPPTSRQFDELMAVARDVPRVLFLTVKLDKPWEAATNVAIRSNVERFDNAELVDWWALADAHPSWFTSDVNCGCHLWSSSARTAYVEMIRNALER
jgi:putative cell wall-binding protein